MLAASTKPFAVRQRAVPGPQGGDRRRPWSSRRPTDTTRRYRVGLGGQSYRTVDAARRSWRRRPRRSSAGSASPLVHSTIVQCDQAISRQPGSRLCPRLRDVDARRRRQCRSSSRRQATRRSWSSRRPTRRTRVDPGVRRYPRCRWFRRTKSAARHVFLPSDTKN